MASFSNSATLSYNGNTTVSNTVVGTLQEVLTATKTAVVDTYSAYGEVTYVVNVVNSGTTELTNLTLTDNLGGYSFGTPTPTTLYPLTYAAGSLNYFVNGVLQATPTVTAGPPLTVTGFSLPAGGVGTLIYQVTANQYAPLGTEGSIINTATISGGRLATPVTATETVTPQDSPVLSISKALSPSVVTDNGQLTYTFTIMNSGNTAADAGDNIILTDTFDPILDPISVTFNGTPWALTTNYTYNTTTGAFATVTGQITVPAATYTQDPVTGIWSITPGTSTLVITGTV